MDVYMPKEVEALSIFYGERLTKLQKYGSVTGHLEALSKRMHEGAQTKQSCILKEISNYHPQFLGKSTKELEEINFSLNDCKITIANEYGFALWTDVESLHATAYDLEFEKAVNALLCGEIDLLTALVSNRPALVRQRSQYGHGATLLHYTASNGVEMWRQKVPKNLQEIICFLLESGTEKAATMKVYGGDFDTKTLLASSVHPAEVGLLEELLILF